MSLPAREEWIEISKAVTRFSREAMSLPAREEWIEIRWSSAYCLCTMCLFPRGKSGLKYCMLEKIAEYGKSLPAREEWIEIRF